jgi:protein-disulfide isomerase
MNIKKIYKKSLLLLVVMMTIVIQSAAADTTKLSDSEFETLMGKYLSSDKGKEALGNTVQKYFMDMQRKSQEEAMKQAHKEMEDQFKNPVKIDPGKSPIKGPANAKITIIEFSDFECPFCKKGKNTMDQVLKAYPNDVKLSFKNLPLPMHENAKPAALAALAAGKQGKFWEFHDALFENQRGLTKEFLETTAKSLGLNVEQFKKDIESPEIKQQVEDDIQLGNKHGIQGTPGFFVNGVAVRGAYPFEHFKQIIDRLLSGK